MAEAEGGAGEANAPRPAPTGSPLQWETAERGRVITAYVTKGTKSKGEIEWMRQLQR